MSTLNEYRACLNDLAAATPRKKAALIRSLLPSIEAALSSGQTLKDIWVALEKRSEEHTSELQSPCNLVCRLLLEKKKRHVRCLSRSTRHPRRARPSRHPGRT